MIRKLQAWYKEPRKSRPARCFRYAAEMLFFLVIAFIIRTVIFGLYQVPTGSMETTLLVGERFVADKLSYWFRSPKRGEIIAFNVPDVSVCSKGYTYSKNPLRNLFERYVYGPQNWTKRVIGVPGDHVKGVIEDGRPGVYVNDKRLDESAYLNKYPLIMVWKSPQDFAYRYQQRDYDLKTFDPSVPWNKQTYYKINSSLIYRDPYTLESLVRYPETPSPLGDDVFDITLGENQYWVMGDNRQGSSDSRVWGPLDGKLIHAKIIYRIWSMDTDESWWFRDFLKNPINFWRKVRWDRCFQLVG